jgi:hypothetical protein
MTDVNEEIVAKYYEMNGYMVHRNLSYKVDKKYAPDSDIDLLIQDLSTGDKQRIISPKIRTSTEFYLWSNHKDTAKRK